MSARVACYLVFLAVTAPNVVRADDADDPPTILYTLSGDEIDDDIGRRFVEKYESRVKDWSSAILFGSESLSIRKVSDDDPEIRVGQFALFRDPSRGINFQRIIDKLETNDEERLPSVPEGVVGRRTLIKSSRGTSRLTSLSFLERDGLFWSESRSGEWRKCHKRRAVGSTWFADYWYLPFSIATRLSHLPAYDASKVLEFYKSRPERIIRR
ncbi:MAG: hypothetical protein AAF958_20205 [Planctomycetota bacterium]